MGSSKIAYEENCPLTLILNLTLPNPNPNPNRG